MLTLIFDFVKSLAVPILYFGGILTSIISIFVRAEAGLFLMVALIPQPNIFYKLYDFPLGKDLLDILFFAVTIGIFVNKKGFERTGNTALAIILIVVSYLALLNSSRNFSLPLPITTANPILAPWKNYAFMIFMYLLTLNTLKGDENQRKLLVVVMTLVVLFISVRSYRSFTPGSLFIETSRSVGPFWRVGLGSNHFAAFIVQYSAVFLGLFFLDSNRWRKMLFLVTVLFSIHPLFFSYSRGAYAAALSVLVFFALARKRSLLILVFVLVVVWEAILPASVVDRIAMTKGEGGQMEGSVAARLDLWDHALNQFNKNPLFGVGFGGYAYTLPPGYWKDAHNYYMKMLAEQGIIGFVLILIVLFSAFRSGWKLYRAGRNGFEQGLGLGFMGCVLACAITNLFGDRWSYFMLGSYFWVFWGLVDRTILMSDIPVSESLENKDVVSR